MKTKINELKPCPICNGTRIEGVGHWVNTHLECLDCHFKVYPNDETADEQGYIDAWNQKFEEIKASNIENQ